jgi:hypothetical protein
VSWRHGLGRLKIIFTAKRASLFVLTRPRRRKNVLRRRFQIQMRRGSLEVNPMKLPTPPPPPAPMGSDGQSLKGGPSCVRASQGPLDYCTLRHGKQQRAVQFADQQLERQGSEVSYPCKLVTRGQCYKTLIYCDSRVIPSFCVIKQYYDSNYGGMEVNCSRIIKTIPTIMVIYHGILTSEMIRLKLRR